MVEDTASHPILKAAMAGLVRRVLLRQIPPLSARPERPENTFKDTTVVLAGTAAGLKARDRRNKRGNNCPLRIGDEHWGEIRPLLLPCSVSVYFETGSINILADHNIFCKFEEKRLMFKKLIEAADFSVKHNKIAIEFDKGKYMELANKIKKVQEIRNDIAHNYMIPDANGAVTYYKGKSYGQILQETGQKKASFNALKLNLEEVQKESIKLCGEWESLMGEMMEKFANIFSH